MNSFFKKASIVLLVVVLVPVIAFLSYLAWLDRQESEVAVMSFDLPPSQSLTVM